MPKRRITKSKKLHEINRYIRSTEIRIYQDSDIISKVDRPTIEIRSDSLGVILQPSSEAFENINPVASPCGIIFIDDSFLVFKEIVNYDYPSKDSPYPTIHRLEYSYHYQRPQDRLFFRYDFHPGLGDPETHPIYHLHAGGWLEDAIKLPSVPRFAVSQITLDEVLALIRRDFFTQKP